MSISAENDLGGLANLIYKLTAQFLVGEIDREEHIKTLALLLERCHGVYVADSMEGKQYFIG